MTKKIRSSSLAETAFGLKNDNPVARMMAGFTGFAVAVTLILATAIPVKADRPDATCAKPIEAVASASCSLN